MNEIDFIKKEIEENLSERRLKHVYSVKDYIEKLSKIFSLDSKKCEIAALGHDIFREKNSNTLMEQAKKYKLNLKMYEINYPLLLHGKIAALYLKEKYELDEEIYQAIYYHTSGCINSNDITKALVISDSAEQTRDYKGVEELRKISEKSLDEAYNYVMKGKITYALKNRLLILDETIEYWNKHVLEVQI
ncbi:bis(5'-nucleosyl)-tetraphosphatase (symmetrical) YqeK [Oceanotoga sp. DSM 15011]|jgi:predicted HD superfamily hydrolase involved in NAD metabolism|uniref:bis(5'-nucleosyl)-tetraphosphatase (symmetrical) YqeK n=1 Tax=Oceanotoga TaxID=1255275 RepID=UPI0021F4C426|nr:MULTISPECIES: bis(5'-nucleosyl)-tetraphosphatase (symmetrical) YqeK [Oceanotoga]MDN5342901.1 hypothetical protein [Oceanotoga sp.]MDO7975381.1 bis(5'-nucleosyl)-tetraphosphatase (symmetrical) YqeK [Oceanotoga teriensis]UYP00115.1 bis(5'-nucleosyl)-tetraphosphatase (symmetrical) YqeK [Oceanotoga sp. DSM 15011]